MCRRSSHKALNLYRKYCSVSEKLGCVIWRRRMDRTAATPHRCGAPPSRRCRTVWRVGAASWHAAGIQRVARGHSGTMVAWITRQTGTAAWTCRYVLLRHFHHASGGELALSCIFSRHFCARVRAQAWSRLFSSCFAGYFGRGASRSRSSDNRLSANVTITLDIWSSELLS